MVHVLQTHYANAFVPRGKEKPGEEIDTFRFSIDNSIDGNGIARCERAASHAHVPIELSHKIFNDLRDEWNAALNDSPFYTNPQTDEQRISNLSLYQTLCNRSGLTPNIV